HAKQAMDGVRDHLGGRLRPLDDVAIDTRALPDFHRRVYDVLRAVPVGETIGYGELATRVGAPRAARGVGQAVARNALPIVVPCHRVLSAGGRVGGFSAYGGVETKRRILAIEGVTLAATRGGLGFDAREAMEALAARDVRLASLIR